MARFPPPQCHPKTREKVLKIITDWVNDPQPRWGIMWLSGPAGAGKSAIAQTIAERCADEQLASSFFFLRNSIERGTTARLFTTLAWQLAKNIPEILSYIQSAIEADPSFHAKTIDVQFNSLITQPFLKLLHDKPNFCLTKSLVIIDGVDECSPDRDQFRFLILIGSALSSKQIPLRFLICSRPEAHIQETFGLEVMTSLTCPVLLDNANEDIRRYLKDEFTRICTERKFSSSRWPPRGVIGQLVSKSHGQFIYASTVIKFVDDTDNDPKSQLDIVLKIRPVESSLPFVQLDQLYIQILSQQPNVRFLKDLFTLIIALRRPKIAFVCRRLRIDNREELEGKLRRLRSIIQISELVIDTYHLSLHEFFLDKKRASKYFIHPARIALVRIPDTGRPVIYATVGGVIVGVVVLGEVIEGVLQGVGVVAGAVVGVAIAGPILLLGGCFIYSAKIICDHT